MVNEERTLSGWTASAMTAAKGPSTRAALRAPTATIADAARTARGLLWPSELIPVCFPGNLEGYQALGQNFVAGPCPVSC